MASLPTRTTASFAAIAPVPNLTVLDDEFNQYVGASGIFNGGTTATKLLTKTSDASDPVYEFDQTGAGPIVEFKQNGTLKSYVNNAGQFVSDIATGTAPFDVDSTTKVTNLNADLLDGLSSADFAQLATHRAPWSVTFVYSVIPGAVETVESVGRLIIPAAGVRIINIGTVWAAGSASGGTNTWTIKRRNSAGALQADIGTTSLSANKDEFPNANVGPTTCSFGDQIYPLLTTRNTGSEQLVSIVIVGDKVLA